MRTSTYWPQLDGLRALGVAAVVIYHADHRLAPNGYVGVDLFFVLSGFLITSLLLSEHERTGSIAIVSFYRRRLVRLLPAMLAVCVAVTLTAPFADSPRDVITGVIATLLYVANWWIYSGNDTVLMQHAWTLSIEEQFYFVWPVLFAVAVRHRWVRVLLGVAAVALWLVSVFVEFSGSAGDVLAGSYFRSFGLIIGCAAAFVPRIVRRIPAAVTIACLVVFVAFIIAPVNLSIGTSVVPALVALPLVTGASIGQSGGAGRLLSSKVATWLGVRSYGLYLWHYPIGSLITNNSPIELPVAVRVVASIVVSVIVSDLSYRFLERPIRERFSNRSPASVRQAPVGP